MDHQYSIINQCLQVLKQSDMPTIKKLRVEIELIHMKRLLLNENLLRHGECGDDIFEELLAQMKRLNGGEGEGAVTELMARIRGMLTVVGGEQAVH